MPVKNLFGTSGVRGLIGKEIDEKFSFKLGLVLGQFYQGKALVGRDPRPACAGRPGAKEISDALIKGLKKSGLSVVDCGILSTPEITWYQVNKGFDLGISVTGSHLAWNMIGIIPTSADGSGITALVGQKITKIYESL